MRPTVKKEYAGIWKGPGMTLPATVTNVLVLSLSVPVTVAVQNVPD
jgi:hypothetical protein